MNLPVLALLAAGPTPTELPFPAWVYGAVMFALLMLSLLITLGFASKGKELPADPQSHH
ncbi:hypothetical protein [Nesterenkonia alkaliphila]|uniref:Uncharacterized protein n=1 Tax=Nesterenkonia alkaliphila TaxID=1463631 RepID=A0A7K1UKN4_9MICC|nr:hypothetical protein [Nesterenkonia alkaliphila]MVT27030.1 hypothetical protein [Nesterenkonia alkaliphila]GFZ94039.1 hypothetical protein GCM10011359_24430 [Nesterenkonia alkaliphila]